MKLAVMLRDVVGSLFQQPVTERYPFERRPPPERLRGRLQCDSASCTGCGLCAKDCPANALQVFALDKKAKRFVLAYHVDRCTFCAQCVFSCRQDCLHMSNVNWELAALDHDSYCLVFGDEDDIRATLGE